MVRGDDYEHEVTLTVDGVAYNGSTSTWSAKLRSAPGASVIATMTVDTTDAATGVLVVTTTDTVTAALTDPSVTWDLQETTAAGKLVTWLRVYCPVDLDITS